MNDSFKEIKSEINTLRKKIKEFYYAYTFGDKLLVSDT